jgi:hypothetical protein
VYEAIGGAVNDFSNAAMNGEVSIEADAAADALAKIGKVKDQLELLQTKAGHGAADVQLGANPVGQAMAHKSMGRYDGSDSFMAAIKLLSQQTAKAEIALKQCIDNYVDIDSAHASKYHRA